MNFPRTPSFSLQGKRALVTGASSGIGLACAVALAEHGADVTLAARSGDKLRQIVDDMAASVKVLAAKLTSEYYDVITAHDGPTALDLVAEEMPDIVLLDVMMPGMDGYEVLSSLGEEENTARIPFIFLTAKAERVDMRLGMNLGADDYLTKPFEEKELLDAVSCRLKKHDFLTLLLEQPCTRKQ